MDPEQAENFEDVSSRVHEVVVLADNAKDGEAIRRQMFATTSAFYAVLHGG